jgi:hypothetical protein
MMARSTTRSNQRPDTLMQDRLSPARQNPLATHGRTIHVGQNRKSSMRAYVFRCAPNNGHRQDTSACVRTIIYVLITFSLVAELPSNNYGKSPLIISSKKCLPESALAEIGRRSEETSRTPPERRGLARSSLLRDRRVNLPFMRWPARQP